MSEKQHPTPQERLAQTRRELFDHMTRGKSSKVEMGARPELPVGNEGTLGSVKAKWKILKKGVVTWWDPHPAHIAVDVATPFVSKYARRYPAKVLGIAAGVGAAAVVLKPWRLVSVGGLLLATMKSSDVSKIVLSMMSESRKSDNNTRRYNS